MMKSIRNESKKKKATEIQWRLEGGIYLSIYFLPLCLNWVVNSDRHQRWQWAITRWRPSTDGVGYGHATNQRGDSPLSSLLSGDNLTAVFCILKRHPVATTKNRAKKMRIGPNRTPITDSTFIVWLIITTKMMADRSYQLVASRVKSYPTSGHVICPSLMSQPIQSFTIGSNHFQLTGSLIPSAAKLISIVL